MQQVLAQLIIVTSVWTETFTVPWAAAVACCVTSQSLTVIHSLLMTVVSLDSVHVKAVIESLALANNFFLSLG